MTTGTEHIRRFLTGVLAIILIVMGVLSPSQFHITLLLVVAFTIPSLYEAWAIMGLQNTRGWLFQSVLVVSTFSQITMALRRMDFTICVLVAGVMAMSLFTMAKGYEKSRARFSTAIFCLFFVSLPLGCLCLIRNGPNGAFLITYLLIVAICSDTGALYIGSLFGKHKFAPQVSPKKTWEGSFGGLFFTLAAVILWAYCYQQFGHECVLWLPPGRASWVEITILTIVITYLSQLGDLSESMLKRDAGVKDSGSAVTGHGGFLDMVDAVLWTAPGTFVYAVIKGIA